MKEWHWQRNLGLAAATVVVLALSIGGLARGQNTVGGDTFLPGEADFVQNGSEVGRGPAFQFSDAFYAANGINAADIRAQETNPVTGQDASGPSRFGAFYRDNIGTIDAGIKPGLAPDDRFINDTRHIIHNMGFNAAGSRLFYPDPPAFFFASAFLDQQSKELANRSFVFLFPRKQPSVRQVNGDGTFNCVPGTPATVDFLDPGPCNRRQDNIFDTGNGYLTDNPLQNWRIVFVTWDGPDVNTPECQAKMAELAARNGPDEEGTPILTSTREILDVAGPDMIAGQDPSTQMVLPNELFNALGARGVPNPDPRSDIPGVEPIEGGQACVTVRTRRQVDGLGNPATPQNPLDGPPFVT